MPIEAEIDHPADRALPCYFWKPVGDAGVSCRDKVGKPFVPCRHRAGQSGPGKAQLGSEHHSPHVKRLATGALLTATAIFAASATSNAAAPRYDGLWSVSIVTEKGDCDRGYRYLIRISKGVLANGGADL